MKKAKTRAQRRRVAMLRKVLLTLTMVMVVAMVTVGGTVAWLADKTDAIVNTFTVGDINIELDESENLDFKMIPGNTIAKDPVVTVKADSEACWLFVKIDKANGYDNYLTHQIADGWTELETGVYYCEVDASDSDQPFYVLKADADSKYPNGCVSVKNTITKTDLDAVETSGNYPTLTFTAYAVQKDNIATAAAAWTEAKLDSNYSASITVNP